MENENPDILLPDILLIEDDVQFGEELRDYLSQYGMTVVHVRDMRAATDEIRRNAPRVIIMDQFVGAVDSLTVLRQIREGFSGGIMMLTGNSDVTDRVVGLELGADDFLSKLVAPREILARVRSLMRVQPPAPSDVIKAPDPGADRARSQWRLDLPRRELYGPDGSEIHLTSTEFSLLAYLSQRQGKPVPREELSPAIFRRQFDPFDRSIDNLISRIRKKFDEAEPGCAAVKNIRNEGYVFLGFNGPEAAENVDGEPPAEP